MFRLGSVPPLSASPLIPRSASDAEAQWGNEVVEPLGLMRMIHAPVIFFFSRSWETAELGNPFRCQVNAVHCLVTQLHLRLPRTWLLQLGSRQAKGITAVWSGTGKDPEVWDALLSLVKKLQLVLGIAYFRSPEKT